MQYISFVKMHGTGVKTGMFCFLTVNSQFYIFAVLFIVVLTCIGSADKDLQLNKPLNYL